MSLRPFRNIDRKKTKVINVGNVKIGGDNPISVQSMTNTLTTDVSATIKQIQEIHEEGADIVRVSCPDEDSSKALKEITKNVQIPVIAEIHFHYKRAIEAAENGAKCLRINPGNIGDKKKIHEFISKVDIITYEFENIPFETLNEINREDYVHVFLNWLRDQTKQN